MAVFERFLDPNADVAAGALEVPAGSAFDRLNDGSRVGGAAPSTASDYIEFTASGQTCTLDFPTYTLVGNEKFQTVFGNLYMMTTLTQQIRCQITTTATNKIIAERTMPANKPAQWQQWWAVWNLSQAMVDGLRLTMMSVGAGNSRVYSGYLKLCTRDDEATVANARVTQRRNNNDGLSLSAGFGGCDAWCSTALGDGRVVIVGADTGWFTGAGQQGALFNSNKNDPAAAHAAFIRNSIHILSTNNIDTAALTSYIGPGTTSYWPEYVKEGATHVRWPARPIVIDGSLYVVGVSVQTGGLTSTGTWMAVCDNFAGTPDTWSWTFYGPWRPAYAELLKGGGGMYVSGGFVYLSDQVPGGYGMYRVTQPQFTTVRDLRGGEWYNPATDKWERDKAGIHQPLMPGIVGRRRPRFPIDTGASPQVRASDGRVQRVRLEETLFVDTPPFHLQYSVAPTGNILTPAADWSADTRRYDLCDGEYYIYAVQYHPHLTFTGAGANDQVWSMGGHGSLNSLEGQNDNMDQGGYPVWVKALSVT